MLEKTLKTPVDSKEIKPVHPKENHPWIFIGRTDAEAPILWPPDAKSQLTGKDRDAGKDWRQEEKGTTENEMVGWHHWLDGHECGQASGVWWTGKPGMLRSMGSQRVGHNWATELNWTELWFSGLCKLIEWDCVELFLGLFPFPLMGKAEGGSNPVCWWLGLYFCFVCLLFRWGVLHRVLLVVGWCWVLYSSGFLCVSSRVLELVLLLQRLRAWCLVKNKNSTSGLLRH